MQLCKASWTKNGPGEGACRQGNKCKFAHSYEELMHFDNAAGEYMDHDDQYGVSDMKISVQLLPQIKVANSCPNKCT